MKVANLEWMGYRWLAWLFVAILGILSLLMVMQMRWRELAGMLFFLGCSVGYLCRDNHLPVVYDSLISLSLLLNALGWTYEYYHRLTLYDELAHLATSFSLGPVLGSYLFAPNLFSSKRWRIQITILYFLMVMGIGALWELFEWALYLVTSDSNIIKSLKDTIEDMFWGGVGGLFSIPLFLRTILRIMVDDRGLQAARPNSQVL